MVVVSVIAVTRIARYVFPSETYLTRLTLGFNSRNVENYSPLS